MKLVVPEPGESEAAEAWLGAERRISSLLLYPESRAAVGRAHRMGHLASTQLPTVQRRLEVLWAGIDRVALTEHLARRAGELAAEYRLRAYDAIHLASLEGSSDRETVLVSADGALLDAARAHGFATVAPSDDG